MKKLFTSLAVCSILSLLMVNCTEEDGPKSIEVIQAELDAFMTTEMKKSNHGPMTPKIMEFLAQRGFVQVTKDMPEYQEMLKAGTKNIDEDNLLVFTQKNRTNLRLADLAKTSSCEVEGSGGIYTDDGYHVYVYEYSDDCYHAGCVTNSWWCDGCDECDEDGYCGEATYC